MSSLSQRFTKLKADLVDRRALIAELRSLATRLECKDEQTAADHVRRAADSEARKIDRELCHLAAATRREMRRRFRVRFQLTAEQDQTLSRLRKGRDFREAWDRLARRPAPMRPGWRPAARAQLATPRRRRASARPAAVLGAPPAEPEPAPKYTFHWPLFAEPDEPAPRALPDARITRYLMKSPIWALLSPRVIYEIGVIASAGPLDDSAVHAIDARLQGAALAADKHPEDFGELWLPGREIPPGALMVRTRTWRLWRVIAEDVIDADGWDCSEGGRA